MACVSNRPADTARQPLRMQSHSAPLRMSAGEELMGDSVPQATLRGTKENEELGRLVPSSVTLEWSGVKESHGCEDCGGL